MCILFQLIEWRFILQAIICRDQAINAASANVNNLSQEKAALQTQLEEASRQLQEANTKISALEAEAEAAKTAAAKPADTPAPAPAETAAPAA